MIVTNKLKENKLFASLFLLTIIFSSLFFFVQFINFGWDTVAYYAIGKYLTFEELNFWDIKYYYPPGLSIIYIFTGVYLLNSFILFKILILIATILNPLIIFLIIRRINEKLAYISWFCIIFSFSNLRFSYDNLPHYFSVFFLISSIYFLTNKKILISFKYQFLFSFFLLFSIACRGTALYAIQFFFAYLYFTKKNENTFSFKVFTKFIFNFIIIYFILVGAFSILRNASMDNLNNNKFFFGISKNHGVRMLIHSSYHGLSQYLGNPNKNIIYKPENGKHSELYFKKFRNFLNNVFEYNEHPLKNKFNTSEEAYNDFIYNPTHDKSWYIAWWAPGNFTQDLKEQDAMLKNIYLEAISNNKIGYLRYFLHNLKTFFIGPATLTRPGNEYCDGEKNYSKCFYKHSTNFYSISDANTALSKSWIKVTNLDLYNKQKVESDKIRNSKIRTEINKFYYKVFNLTAHQRYIFTLSAILGLIILFREKKTFYILLLFFSINLTLGILTSLIYPANDRYGFITNYFGIIYISFFIYKISKFLKIT